MRAASMVTDPAVVAAVGPMSSGSGKGDGAAALQATRATSLR